MRMKSHMTAHIDDVRNTMFSESTQRATRSLEDMVKAAEKNMLSRVDEVFLSVKRDYTAAVVGGTATGQAFPREQRIMRMELHRIVEGSEKMFKRVVGLEPEDGEQEEARQDNLDNAFSGDKAAKAGAEEPDGDCEDAVTSVRPESKMNDDSMHPIEPEDDLTTTNASMEHQDTDDMSTHPSIHARNGVSKCLAKISESEDEASRPSTSISHDEVDTSGENSESEDWDGVAESMSEISGF
jgi:hypothetical protein